MLLHLIERIGCHDDVGFISYDRSRKALALRQFHVEGFVSQYRQNQPAAAAVLSFTSKAIENIPPDCTRESDIDVSIARLMTRLPIGRN